MFPLFSSLAVESEADLGPMRKLMRAHVSQTLPKFKEYFPSRSDPRTGKQRMRDPSTTAETDSTLPPTPQDKLLELSCDGGLHAHFNQMQLSEF